MLRTLLILAMCLPTLTLAKGLSAGAPIPQFETTTISGQKLKSPELYAQGPLVVVFYRGGWCPYCNLEMRRLEAKIFPVLESHKGQMVAISVDRVEPALMTQSKHKLSFWVVSDPQLKLHEAFGVRLKLDQKTVENYQAHGIDLEKASGEKHHTIALPATYVVDRRGMITYAYVNADYKTRAPTEEVLAAIRKAAG